MFLMFCIQNLNVVSGTKHSHCSLGSLLLKIILIGIKTLKRKQGKVVLRNNRKIALLKVQVVF